MKYSFIKRFYPFSSPIRHSSGHSSCVGLFARLVSAHMINITYIIKYETSKYELYNI